MIDKNQIIRRVHALAKEIWGEQEIAGEPAYIFWTRVWAKLRYGVEQRRELDVTQWLEMERWLKSLKGGRSKNGKSNLNL
jgi:hypothetical protein